MAFRRFFGKIAKNNWVRESLVFYLQQVRWTKDLKEMLHWFGLPGFVVSIVACGYRRGKAPYEGSWGEKQSLSAARRTTIVCTNLLNFLQVSSF